MAISEKTASASLWIFDNILRCCKQNGSDHEVQQTPIAEYLEMLFGCIIVYQMYDYDVYPSTHFYQISFNQNEFWKFVKDVYFEYYVRLLFHIKQLPTVNNYSSTKHDCYHTVPRHRRSERLSSKRPSSAREFVNKFMNSTPSKPTSCTPSSSSTVHNIYHDLFAKRITEDGPTTKTTNIKSPITVAQSEPETVPNKADIEAQEEVIIGAKHDVYGHIATISLSSSSDDDLDSVSMEMCDDDCIILTQHQYLAIENNLKVLLQTISRSTFCRNKIPSAFIGHGLLSATGPGSVRNYRYILNKVYRHRHKLDV